MLPAMRVVLVAVVLVDEAAAGHEIAGAGATCACTGVDTEMLAASSANEAATAIALKILCTM